MARGWFPGTRWASLVALSTVAAAALASSGCAIHTQGPIKEIAYDFSDRDFYDRAYATSPKYLETDPPYGMVESRAAAQASSEASVDAAPVSRRPARPVLRRPATVRMPANPLRTSD